MDSIQNPGFDWGVLNEEKGSMKKSWQPLVSDRIIHARPTNDHGLLMVTMPSAQTLIFLLNWEWVSTSNTVFWGRWKSNK
jgi:hypothetical protein